MKMDKIKQIYNKIKYIYNKIKKWTGVTTLTIGFLILLVTAALFFYQVYLWLKNGSWTSIPLNIITIPFRGTSFTSWLEEPAAWYGLHKVITVLLRVPLWLAMFILGAFLVAIGTSVEDKANRELSALK